ncbi:MAG: flagellar basal body P-ring formation chaperone FlgA, partial [Planctomycetaceae bacterium]
MHGRSLTTRTTRRSRLPALALALAAWSVCGLTAGAGEQFRVHLRDDAVFSGGIVRLRDIADVTGVNTQSVAQLGDIDVAVLTAEMPKDRIDRDRIAARLLLAGYDGRHIAITGASAIPVRWRGGPIPAQAIDAKTVESAARFALATAFGVNPDDVEARLTTPLNLSLPAGAGPLTVDAVPPVKPQPGRIRMALRIFSGVDLLQVTNGLFDVRLRQQVILASATLPVGTILTANSVTYQERWATKRDNFPQQQALPQWRVRRSIQAGETITSDDLIPVGPQEEEPFVIRARDVVQLVARGKGINATVPAAEALESGRIGDKIRVRNMHSRRIVVGEIVSSEEVQVTF